jgi:hypothetical protein
MARSSRRLRLRGALSIIVACKNLGIDVKLVPDLPDLNGEKLVMAHEPVFANGRWSGYREFAA